MSNKILFFGNERLATGVTTSAPTLQSLIQTGYEISGVILAQNEIGQSRQSREPEIVQVANEHNIDVLVLPNLRDNYDKIASLNCEVGVLVAYGKIVPQNIIDLFPRGIVNIHPSLLPKHRGPTPIESSILNGDSETGVSLMQLSSNMDAGPLYAQANIQLNGNESKQELADKLLSLGNKMLIDNLSKIIDGSLYPKEQDNSQATYDTLIVKTASELDFNKPANQLVREIRAYSGWPRSKTVLSGIDCIVAAAHSESHKGDVGKVWREANQFGIFTSDGVLVIDRLIPAGKNEMDALSFINGYLK